MSGTSSAIAAPAAVRSCEIVLQNPCRYSDVAARSLRPWVHTLITELAPSASTFTARFLSDREMRRLNATFRQRDQPTDVLSFPGDLDPGLGGSAIETEEELHLGDVAISVPTARRQAAAAGHSTARELRLLLLHGMLHCLGHDHETDDGSMERLEQQLRERWLDHG